VEHPETWAERFSHDTEWNVEHLTSSNSAAYNILQGMGVIAVLYCLGGVIVNVLMFGSQGMDAIPHAGFWAEYPALVLDGMKVCHDLVINTVQGTVPKRRGAHDPPKDAFNSFSPAPGTAKAPRGMGGL